MVEEKKPKAGEEAPKTPEEKTSEEKIKVLKKENESLRIQKEHFRTQAQELGKELEELKIKASTPSDKDLSKEIEDWEMLSPTEQRLIREQMTLKKEIEVLKKISTKADTQLQWKDNFSNVVRIYPELLKKEREFKEHCEKLGIISPTQEQMEALAKSFLFEEAEEIGAKKEKEKAERPGLETATGGEKPLPSPEMSLADIKRLRTEHNKEYLRLIREGKIKKLPEE